MVIYLYHRVPNTEKLKEIITPEEKEKIEEIYRELVSATSAIALLRPTNSLDEIIRQKTAIAEPFLQRINAIEEAVRMRYITAFDGNEAAIISDVKEILEKIGKDDFLKEIELRKKTIPSASFLEEAYNKLYEPDASEKKEKLKKIPEHIKRIKKTTVENFENCYEYLYQHIEDQVKAMEYYGFSLESLSALIEEKASMWYTPEKKNKISDSQYPIRCIPDFEEQQPPKISTSKLPDILYPIDKVNAELWNRFSIGENTPLKAESDKDSRKGKQASIYVMLDFNELDGVKLSRPLTSFDQRVFVSISNIRESGQEIATLSQIYDGMGSESRASAQIRSKIIESIETMSRAVVKIDTTEENKIYPRLDKIVWESQLLHIEKVKGYSRGQITDYAIRIIEVPKLFLFAKNRGQITTVPIKLLESPISKTEANLLLENYLLSRIARMRNNTKITRTILVETVRQKCNIKTACQRQRLPGKIEKYLKHYVSVGWIKAYKLTDKSIEIVTYSV